MKQTAAGFIKLGIGIVILWGMVFHICPAVIEMIPAYKRYADEVERRGIHTGALFYTNVEESTEAEFYVRNALRFPTRPAPAQ
ncbi:hypothetical protein KL86DPRO_10051 [uncultured delta proteobacterium]|uniref:Uncharacterized protein n=1 Tax=uncultured delta proteobacterium TaxID=34034 RepID=A0A212ITP1_9DELT|nr:hypothetical protein KL86DPRO_10051 [uncultured delta proteobacterium]